MTSLDDRQNSHDMFSLTRMIYAVSSATILYKILEIGGWFLLWKAQNLPWGLSRLDLLFHAANLSFVLAMLTTSFPYHPKSELFRWSSLGTAGAFKSIGLGLVGGVVAFALACPVFWFGDRQLDPIRSLIAHALTPVGVLDLAFFIIALAVSSEIVYRGVVFRTLADYASAPAAGLASCLLFGMICPVLSFPAAVILGIVSAILYHRTRNLLASIIANALFTTGGAIFMLYRSLMRN